MRRTKSRATLLSLTMFALLSSIARSLPQNLSQRLDDHLVSRHSEGFCGAALIAEDGVVLLRKGYGLADRSTGRELTPETGFDIGSITKVFTAAAIFKLMESSKLQFDTKLGSLLDEVPSDKQAITVGQLVMHTSGLPDIVDAESREVTEYDVAFDYELVDREEIVRRAMASTLHAEPGEVRRYSNLGYSLLGVVIERVSEQPYEEFLREHLFVPAGMTRTGYRLPGWSEEDLAVGYRAGEAWGTPLSHEWLADGPSWNLRANGGMISNVDDLYRWVNALQEHRLLSPAVQERYLEAMGVRRNRRGERSMGPAGSNGIFNAVYLWSIERRRVIILLTNVDRYAAEEELQRLLSARAGR